MAVVAARYAHRTGYPCSACGEKTKVVDSRMGAIGCRRRRRCIACGKRETTYELPWPSDPKYRSAVVALVERALSLSPAGAKAMADVLKVLEASEGRAKTAANLSRAWKELAKRRRPADPVGEAL